MTNEEAIEVLKCCITDDCENCQMIVENAYICAESSFSPTFVEVPKDVLLQVLELSKEQQPRVLTLEEINALPEGTVVWEEFMDEDGDTDQTTPSMKWGMWTLVNGEGEATVETGYGIRGWKNIGTARSRWWSAKPTDKQREATPWDEPQKEGESEWD